MREIARTLEAEGLRGSKSTIAAWLKRKPAPGEVSTTPTTPSDASSVLELLSRSVRATEKLAGVAEREGRLSEFSTLTRTLGQLVTLVGRLTPPAPPPVDDDPLLVAAATRAREKLLDRVERRARGLR
ncbi:MAG: hypothetical protein IT377_27775 [Polyangiaceae bacterium]|nr:hypothetical protein [Polyangiaceae bacterium]